MVLEVDGCCLFANNITGERVNGDLWMRFNNFNLEFETERAVTLNLKLFRVVGVQCAAFAEINEAGEQFVTSPIRVDHWEGMDGDEDLISLTVNTNGIVVILVTLVARRGELHINVFRDARWDHALLVVANFEVGRLRWKHMEPLRCR